MPGADAAFTASADRPAFSNGHEGEVWENDWCGTCVHGGQVSNADGGGCPLLGLALLGRTPAEWEPRVPGGLLARYECTAYRAADPGRDVLAHVRTLPSWPAA